MAFVLLCSLATLKSKVFSVNSSFPDTTQFDSKHQHTRNTHAFEKGKVYWALFTWMPCLRIKAKSNPKRNHYCSKRRFSPLRPHTKKAYGDSKKNCGKLAVLDREISNKLPELQFLRQRNRARTADDIHLSLTAYPTTRISNLLHHLLWVSRQLHEIPIQASYYLLTKYFLNGRFQPGNLICTICPPFSWGYSHCHPFP